MYCSRCGNQVSDGDQFCDKCGAKMGGGTEAGPAPSYVVSIRDKSAGVAVVLSFFFMGLGQIYVGKIKRGLLLLMADVGLGVVVSIVVIFWLTEYDAAATLLAVLVIISVLMFVLWVWNLFDAYKLANQYNDHLKAHGTRPW